MVTFNPFKLLALCLQPSGRFSRSQFALVHLGSLALSGFAVVGATLVGAALDLSAAAIGALWMLLLLAFFPVLVVTFVGGGVRRWHDLGLSGWYVFLGFVPCVGLVAVLYMLLAPGRPDAEAPSESPLALVAATGVILVGFFVVGVVASIVLPFLAPSMAASGAATREDPPLRRASASANETMTIADVRTMISAQEAYRDSNGGLYEGNLECLARPSSPGCAPGLPAETLPFIDEALASPEPRYGYRRRFEPGRTVPADPALSSRTGVAGFAYVAVPETPGRTGKRSFCGDSSGIVCYRSDGEDIPAPGGECPVTSGGCEPLA